MKPYYIKRSLALCITGILLWSGCRTTVVERRNIICLIDYSGSISEERLAQYAEIITQDIFLNLDEYDRFVVLPIDQGSRTEPTKIVHEDLQAHAFSEAGDGFTHDADSIDSRKHRYLIERSENITQAIMEHRLKRTAFVSKTDIFSSLEEVARLLESTSPNTKKELQNFVLGEATIYSRNVLIIFSDMIHESAEYSFAAHRKRIYAEKVLTDLQTDNRIPNLANTKVLVHGRTGKTTEQVESLLYFWDTYFQSAQAELVAYEYDSRSWIVKALR